MRGSSRTSSSVRPDRSRRFFIRLFVSGFSKCSSGSIFAAAPLPVSCHIYFSCHKKPVAILLVLLKLCGQSNRVSDTVMLRGLNLTGIITGGSLNPLTSLRFLYLTEDILPRNIWLLYRKHTFWLEFSQIYFCYCLLCRYRSAV